MHVRERVEGESDFAGMRALLRAKEARSRSLALSLAKSSYETSNCTLKGKSNEKASERSAAEKTGYEAKLKAASASANASSGDFVERRYRKVHSGATMVDSMARCRSPNGSAAGSSDVQGHLLTAGASHVNVNDSRRCRSFGTSKSEFSTLRSCCRM